MRRTTSGHGFVIFSFLAILGSVFIKSYESYVAMSSYQSQYVLGNSVIHVNRDISLRAQPRIGKGFSQKHKSTKKPSLQKSGGRSSRKTALFKNKIGAMQKVVSGNEKSKDPVSSSSLITGEHTRTQQSPTGLLAGAASGFLQWALDGLGGIAGIAADATCKRAIELVRPALAGELGGGKVHIGELLDKRFEADGAEAMMILSFPVRGQFRSGTADVRAAVLPGGLMEIRRLTVDGRELKTDVQPQGARDASLADEPVVVDVDKHSPKPEQDSESVSNMPS